MTTFWKILYGIGYITLIGPPRAVLIHRKANEFHGELAGKPFWFIIIAEWLVRSGIFLVVATTLESVLGDYMFERINSDLFLGAMIIAGIFHTTSYYACFNGRWTLNKTEQIYRLCRNICYSVIPAFLTSGIATIIEISRPDLLSDDMPQDIFVITLVIAILAGLVEALIVKRQPQGLGYEFIDATKSIEKTS